MIFKCGSDVFRNFQQLLADDGKNGKIQGIYDIDPENIPVKMSMPVSISTLMSVTGGSHD